MRWNKTCTLCLKYYSPDEEGVMRVTDVLTEVFCNEYKIGAHTWSSMYEIGISPDVELQLRSIDYSGQRDVLYEGKWYSVEIVNQSGDYVRLILRHQQSDSDDTGENDG